MSSIKHYLETFIQGNCGKQLKCMVCDCWLPSSAEKFISSHVSGRKHNVEVEKKRKREDKLKRSVYIRGFDPLLAGLEKELRNYFKAMGVPQIKDIYIDKNSGTYGIVEFDHKDIVDTVLNQKRELFHSKVLTIKRREASKKEVISSSVDIDALQDVTFLLPFDLRGKLEMMTNVDDEMKLLMDYYSLSDDDNDMRKLIGLLIQSVLEELYPQCKVLQFGSSSNGLGEKNCDVDLTLISDSIKDLDDGEVCAEIREVIQRFAPGCKNVSIVQSAKTCSIVKFQHTDSNLSVDLSVNNLLAVRNTELIKAYMKFDERVPMLMFTIRKWAKCFGLSGRNKKQITQYSLTVLVIYFLQRMEPPVLPCLQKVNQEKEVIIGDWNCSFSRCTKDENYKNDLSAGELLFDFFKFYGSFDFNVNVITIHTNVMITREDVKLALNALNLGAAENDFKFGSALVVQDPFKLTHNVTHNLSTEGLQLLLENFEQAYSRKSEVNAESLITLRHLFERRKKCLPRNKQKRKRNRSSIYTISLPNCSHANNCSDLECIFLIKKILVEDLRMRISGISNNVYDLEQTDCFVIENDQYNLFTSLSKDDQNTVDEKLKEVVTDTDNIPKTYIASSSKRTRDDDINLTSKKRKVDVNDDLISFVATAYADTWTNRRKERRLLQKIKEENEIEAATKTELNEDADSGIIMSDISNSDARDVTATTTSHVLLEFNVCIKKAIDENEVCQLKLEPLDESKNKQDFQTFHAYLKKELISVFK